MSLNHQELNSEIINDLLEVLGNGFFEIMHEQIEQADEYMQELRHSCAEGDAKTTQRVAHALKSSLGQVGMQGVFRLAKALEYQARDDAEHKGRLSPEGQKLFGMLEEAFMPAVRHLLDYASSQHKALQKQA